MVQPLDGLVVDKNTTKIDYDSCQRIDLAWFTVYSMDVQAHRGVSWVCGPGTVGDAWHSLQKIHPIAPNWAVIQKSLFTFQLKKVEKYPGKNIHNTFILCLKTCDRLETKPMRYPGGGEGTHMLLGIRGCAAQMGYFFSKNP